MPDSPDSSAASRHQELMQAHRELLDMHRELVTVVSALLQQNQQAVDTASAIVDDLDETPTQYLDGSTFTV